MTNKKQPNEINKDIYLEKIKSTGFELEFQISKSLINEKWTVINGKYYIDDVQDSAREIDILAYKASSINSILVYTVLIISCKKSKENAWVLMAKDKNVKEPNIDWSPVTLWSNQKTLNFVIENSNWKDNYIISSQDLYKNLFYPEKHIFAFQEMNRKNGKAKDDKAIFNSIVTCMKSQNYEISSLNKRKKEKALYNFNLISIMDAPLLRINYGEEEPNIEEINSDIYVGSYIINKKETDYRVHFIKSDVFDNKLLTYNKLHQHNLEQISILSDSFYNNCLQDKKKIELFKHEFNNFLKPKIYKIRLEIKSNENINIKNVSVGWNDEKEYAEIYIDNVYYDIELNKLNSNDKIKTIVKKALDEIYHYKGAFYFADAFLI